MTYSTRFGLIVRYRDALNYYVCYRMTGGTSVLRISKVVNGLETVLKSAPSANPAKDAMFQLSCSAESSTLTLELGASRLDGLGLELLERQCRPGHGLRGVARRQGTLASGG